MSENYEDQIQALMEKVWEAPDAAGMVEAYESAIRLADTHADAQGGFGLRTEAFQSFSHAGMQDRLLVHMAWCLARCDEDPETFPVEDLLWSYKWVIQDAVQFPGLSRDKIAAICDDFVRRMALRGEGERTRSYIRMGMHTDQNNFNEALKEFDVWPNIDRDRWSDCEACEANKRVLLMAGLKRDEDAFVEAEPLIKNRMSCHEEPHYTFTALLTPALRLGRYEQAAKLYAKALPALQRMEKSHGALGRMVAFLALSHNPEPAIRIIEQRLEQAMTLPMLIDRMDFYIGVDLLLRRVGAQSIRLALPAAHPLKRQDDTYAVAALRDWFDGEIGKLVRAFDTRNGNTFVADHLAERRAMLETTPPIELPQMKSRKQRKPAPEPE